MPLEAGGQPGAAAPRPLPQLPLPVGVSDTKRGSVSAFRNVPGMRLYRLLAQVLIVLAVAAGEARAETAAVAVYYDGPDARTARAIPTRTGPQPARPFSSQLGSGPAGALLRRTDRAIPGRVLRGRGVRHALPRGFLADAAASDRPFCWMGRHIGQFLATREGKRLGLRYVDYRDDLESGKSSTKASRFLRRTPTSTS